MHPCLDPDLRGAPGTWRHSGDVRPPAGLQLRHPGRQLRSRKLALCGAAPDPAVPLEFLSPSGGRLPAQSAYWGWWASSSGLTDPDASTLNTACHLTCISAPLDLCKLIFICCMGSFPSPLQSPCIQPLIDNGIAASISRYRRASASAAPSFEPVHARRRYYKHFTHTLTCSLKYALTALIEAIKVTFKIWANGMPQWDSPPLNRILPPRHEHFCLH